MGHMTDKPRTTERILNLLDGSTHPLTIAEMCELLQMTQGQVQTAFSKTVPRERFERRRVPSGYHRWMYQSAGRSWAAIEQMEKTKPNTYKRAVNPCAIRGAAKGGAVRRDYCEEQTRERFPDPRFSRADKRENTPEEDARLWAWCNRKPPAGLYSERCGAPPLPASLPAPVLGEGRAEPKD